MKIHLGLDLDNTLITYDTLFFTAALDAGLIPPALPATKSEVRRHLVESGNEPLFTELQGLVYGRYINQASPAPGLIQSLQQSAHMIDKISIVSHKTRFPIIGPTYDLHQAALTWIEANILIHNVPLSREDIFFLEKKDAKIAKISEIECQFFIDDLLSIVTLIKPPTQAILYTPQATSDYLPSMSSWAELPTLLSKLITS